MGVKNALSSFSAGIKYLPIAGQTSIGGDLNCGGKEVGSYCR
jgi:hypothetical protein